MTVSSGSVFSKLRVALAAEESAGLRVFHEIHNGQWELVAVLSSSSSESRRGVVVREVAAKLGYPVWPAQDVTTPALAARLRAANVDLLLNIYSLFKIHPDVVGAARIGGFNLHPGPLPEYAGLNAPSWAIVNGEQSHAVTLHWLEADIDTGAVAFTTPFSLSDLDTGLSVSAKCVEHGLPLVRRLLETAQTNPDAIPRITQDKSRRCYFGRREVPYGGRVPWALSAGAVTALIRASDYTPLPSPWAAPLARVGTREIGVGKARRTTRPCEAPPGTVGRVGNAGAEVATADEWVLVTQLEVDGRRVRPEIVLKPGLQLS